jgi:hypothetical protein
MSGIRLSEENNLISYVDTASSTITYIGLATPGSLETDSVWQIAKVLVSGTVIKTMLANGNSSFTSSWSNRASLTYL